MTIGADRHGVRMGTESFEPDDATIPVCEAFVSGRTVHKWRMTLQLFG